MSAANESSTVSEVDATESLVEPVETAQPLLRVVKGDPTPEELAALIAVVAARRGAAVRPRRRTRSEWGHPAHQMRGWHRRGPDAWRRSAFGG